MSTRTLTAGTNVTFDTSDPDALTVNVAADATKAPLASPALTGTPTAPTASAGTSTTQLATTAFVAGELTAKAPLASPTFTGTPAAPTATGGTNTTQLATTAFVAAAVAAAGSALTIKEEGANLTTAATSLDFVGASLTATNTGGAVTVTSTAAPLASPAFTGTPTAPTATAGTNTTQIATTAFVDAAVAVSGSSTVKYTVHDPMIPDSSPDPLTDEFTNAATLSNFSGVNLSGATVDINTSAVGRLFVEAPSNSYLMRSLMVAIPSGDFTIHTSVSQLFSSADAAFGGILLADGVTAGTGKQTAAVLGRGAASSLHHSFGRLTWANYGSGATSAVLDQIIYAAPRGYLRLRRVSGTYYRAFSVDGEVWWELAMGLLSGLTPTHVGLFVQNFAGTTGQAAFDFFRVYQTGTQYKTGATRNVLG